MIHDIKITFLHSIDSLFFRTNQIFHNKKYYLHKVLNKLFKIPHFYDKIKRELH